jgi:predicted RNA-binding protein
MNYWLAVGTPENWQTAFSTNGLWGLKITRQNLWDQLTEKDFLFFYATKPIGGIIGFGVIQTKFKQKTPIWPDELKKHEVIWPLRFEFDITYCLPQIEWSEKKMVVKELIPRAGFQMINEKSAMNIISSFGKENAFSINTVSNVTEKTGLFVANPDDQEKELITHDQAKKALVKIGSLQKFICQEEYPFDTGKLDVVWRRVEKSVPTYVFEVQVGGDIYHALGKLKPAYDLWNSHIFLVASQEDQSKVNLLLSGTFHEINSRMKFISLNDTMELYKRKKAYFEYEKELGIY